MTEREFKRKVEPFLHIIPNGIAVMSGIFLLATQNFNSIGMFCWIAPSPAECVFDPTIECIRGTSKQAKLQWIFLGVPISLVFIIITVAMIAIVRTVRKQKRRNIQSGGDNDCAGGSRRNNHNARNKRDRRSQASRASSTSVNSNGIMGVLGNRF